MLRLYDGIHRYKLNRSVDPNVSVYLQSAVGKEKRKKEKKKKIKLVLLLGINCCLNSSSIDYFLQFEPQPTSVKTLVQFAESEFVNKSGSIELINVLIINFSEDHN